VRGNAARSVLRSGARIGVAFGLGIVLAELFLRGLGVSYPPFFTEKPFVGSALLPGAEGWWNREGRAYIRINSDGLRDREHTLEKPPNTLRIAVLGDSFAQAFELPMEKAFWAVLEGTLSGCRALAGRAVEVINFGVSGYGTAQELLTLRYKAWRYDPDVVLLAFFTANDVRNNSRALQGGNRPYFDYRGGELVLDERYTEKRSYRIGASALGPPRDWLRRHSRLWQVGHATRKAWKRRAEPVLAPGSPFGEPGLDDEIYHEPEDRPWREAWRVTEGLLRLMDAEVRARGARLMIVTLSNPPQVHPDPEQRRQFARRVRAPDLLYPDRRLEHVAREAGIPFFMLAPVLREWAERTGNCVHGFANSVLCGGHWNALGHRVAGEAIAAALCAGGFGGGTSPHVTRR